MNKDSNLEQLLRSLGQDSIERPSDLEAKTLERMHTSLPKTQGRDRAKYLGVLVAAALLLIGFLGTQCFLTWFSGPAPGTPGVDLSTDPRIVAAQEKVDFGIALPTWIPDGFSLDRAEVSETGDSITLILNDSRGKGSLTIEQSPYLNHIFPAEIEYVDFIRPKGKSSPARGYLYETLSDPETLFSRKLLFPSHGVYITVISWGMVWNSTDMPKSENVLDKDVIVEIARRMMEAEDVELVPPEDIYEFPRQWGGHIPREQLPGYKYQSARITSSESGITVQTNFSPGIAADPTKTKLYYVVLSNSLHTFPIGAEKIDINGVTGFLSTDGDILKLTFPTAMGTGEVHSVANSLTRAELLAVAQSVLNSQHLINLNGSAIIPTPDFISSFVNLAAGDIPHIKLGETIELDFAGDPPDSVQVLDHLLTEDGVIQYTAREVIERAVQLFEDKGSFPLERHHAASLSSQYLPPPSLRGFRVICSWGEEIREYAYVIKADE